MAEKMELVKQTGTQQISDPLERCIIDLVNAMRSDFGNRFKSQFSDDKDALRMYKRRLYAKLRGRNIEFVYAAYESYIDTTAEWPPTVPELVGLVDKAEKDAKKAKDNALEAERVAALPPPTIQCNPMEMLANAKVSNKPKTREEWLQAKSELLQNHNAVLVLHGRNIRKPKHEFRSCCIPGCRDVGAISLSTKGDGNFFCGTHFQEVA